MRLLKWLSLLRFGPFQSPAMPAMCHFFFLFLAKKGSTDLFHWRLCASHILFAHI